MKGLDAHLGEVLIIGLGGKLQGGDLDLVQIAFLEEIEGLVGVLDDLEDLAFEVRFLAVVVVPAFDNDLAVALPAYELVRPAADGGLGVLQVVRILLERGILFPVFIVLVADDVFRQDGVEHVPFAGGQRLLVDEADGQVIEGGDGLELVSAAAERLGRHGVVHDGLPGEGDIVGGQGVPVVPLESRAQLDGPGLVVLGLFPGFDHRLVDDPFEVGVEGEETVKEGVFDVGLVDARCEERVEGAGVGFQVPDEGLIARDLVRFRGRLFKERVGIDQRVFVGRIGRGGLAAFGRCFGGRVGGSAVLVVFTLVAAAGHRQQENKKSGPQFHVDSLHRLSALFTALEPSSNPPL